MLPILLDLHFIKIYTFGVFLVLAFFWSAFFLWKNVLLTSYKEEDIFDGLFVSIVGGLFVGRLFYVALHFEDFGFSILKFILINGYPGLDIFGILVGGLFTFYLFCTSRKIKFSKVIDYTIPPLMAAFGIAKIGSFFSGAEIGAQTKFLVSMKYANYDGMRHLTPFYESILFFLGAFIAYKLLFNIRRGKHDEGLAFKFFWFFTSLIFVIFDPLKSFHTVFFGQSFNMIIFAIILLTSTVYFIYYFRAAIISRLKFTPKR